MCAIIIGTTSSNGNNPCRDYIMLAVPPSKLVVSRDELEWIITNCKPPAGFVWSWTTIGAPLGQVKVYIKKDTPSKYRDTDLEREFEKILKELGLREGADYVKQYPICGRYVDFALPALKVGFEPGATYWHTPQWVRGEPLNPIGPHPTDVYYPPIEKDIMKHQILTENGWAVYWLNETFRKYKDDIKQIVKQILDETKEFSNSNNRPEKLKQAQIDEFIQRL